MTNHRLHNFFVLAAVCCFFYRCTPNLQLIKVEPQGSPSVPVFEKRGETVDTVSADTILYAADSVQQEIDFAAAFDSTTVLSADTCSDRVVPTDSSLFSFRYQPYKVIKRGVRIALERNISLVSLYSDGKLQIRSGILPVEVGRGKFLVQSTKNKKISITYLSRSIELTLPCTLRTINSFDLIKVNQIRYRGSLILTSERNGVFSIINHLDVEDYLRGVVPLEIGKRPEELIEALKAQAVAARTFTYKRMQERKRALFDMTATVQDQVYGGADTEYRESDLAIRMTADLILVCGDSLVQAYYHSTCGGKTANIEDVWERPACSYLRSISDTDSSGQPYCHISPRFSWQEQWPSRIFYTQILYTLQKMYPGKVFRGGLDNLAIKDSFSCGRVKICSFIGHNWTMDIGGDKLRFIIRRYTKDKSILRSANFKIISLSSKEVMISGTGYGHGVGMCQMGAIGRAQNGQPFDTILKAYYTGVNICTAVQRN